MTSLAWVVGAGGLLGRHVASAVEGRAVRFAAPTIPWADVDQAGRVLRQCATRLQAEATSHGLPWTVYWCAGAGVTSTGPEALANEVAALHTTLNALTQAHSGTVFVASSVGGVYAGNPHPPYSESSDPAPLAPYGQAKLRAEEAVRAWSEHTGGVSVVGRISNLYGAGQNLAKPQGLISQICANYVRRRPSSIWVPLDTIRDYIYVSDCAELLVDVVERAATTRTSVTKILASGQGVPISGVLGEFKRVVGRRPEILLGSSPASAFQALDLSVRSHVWPDLDARPLTPMAVGINRTIEALQLDWGALGAGASA